MTRQARPLNRVVQPVNQVARLVGLDVLRGFALLGILVLNIQWFAMPAAGAMNPTVWGDSTGVNFVIWLFSHLLAEQKMMVIFSMLFGAGLVLFSDRMTDRGQSPWYWHRRRMFWLLLFGLAHGYLLWYGDILFLYAVCGLIVFPLRNLAPIRLMIIGVALLAVYSALNGFIGWSISYWPAEELHAFKLDWVPPPEQLADEVSAYRGGWRDQMAHRAPEAFFMQTFNLVFWGFWRAAGMMLIGMGLYRLGVLSAEASATTYWLLIAAAALVGLPLVAYGVYWNVENEWAALPFFFGMQYNYWGSILVSLGWVSLSALLIQHGVMAGMTRRLAAVGRMAFSNYILHTLICGFIFYGHGLGLFGQVERVGQMVIVTAIWTVQLVASPVWLSHFRHGPLEWLWRSLTYNQPQPFRLFSEH